MNADPAEPHGRTRVWTAAALLAAAPIAITLCVTLWRTPYPITEAVALFEDVARNPPSRHLIPDGPYYRPLFYLTLSALWENGASLESALASIKLVQIIPVLLSIVLLLGYLAPKTMIDAAIAAVAAAVLVGSPGFRDNLELPLSYTTVGIAITFIVWMLLNRQPRGADRIWHAPVIVALTILAIGFKEQGLVLVAIGIAAWWARAPGASGRLAGALAVVGIVYVTLRLAGRGSWAPFEQAVGLGFIELEPRDAAARFSAFPYWMYAYNSLCTIAEILFAEPARGIFRIVQAFIEGRPQTWQFIHVGSSTALTTAIAWWGIRSLRATGRSSPDSRLFVVLLVAIAACGALSFNYSRARLGGMAVPLYSIAAFHAMREAAARAIVAPRMRFALVSLGLMLIAAAWETRAMATVEYARATSLRNQTEWLVLLPARRLEFADRPVYLQIMHSMIEQGTDPSAPRPVHYPPWVALTIGQP